MSSEKPQKKRRKGKSKEKKVKAPKEGRIYSIRRQTLKRPSKKARKKLRRKMMRAGVKMREPGSQRRQRKRVSDGLYHHSPK